MTHRTLNATNSLWVVEMWINEPGVKREWAPTYGVAFSRDDARKELAEWRERNPDDKCRLRRYARVK